MKKMMSNLYILFYYKKLTKKRASKNLFYLTLNVS